MKTLLSGIFNRALGLPPGIERFTGTWKLEYTLHAKRASLSDRYGQITLPQTLRLVNSQIVEVEMVSGRAVKAVVRIPHTDTHDLVLVVCDPMDGYLLVKTVWLNDKADEHATLKTESLTVFKHA